MTAKISLRGVTKQFTVRAGKGSTRMPKQSGRSDGTFATHR